eukprot:m.177244 g.177244  ORF g.177244 m.177244 type:complete len:52 (-) comp31877_c1_seq1:85-240(-)
MLRQLEKETNKHNSDNQNKTTSDYQFLLDDMSSKTNTQDSSKLNKHFLSIN